VLPARFEPREPATKSEVVPAAVSSSKDSRAVESHTADLVLPSDRPMAVESLELRPGQIVRPESGRRARLLLPPEGLSVAVEDVCFEDIDFVASRSLDRPNAGDSPRAVIRLGAARAVFRGCSFQAASEGNTLPVAIAWLPWTDSATASLSLPSGRVRVTGCLFQRVDAAIESRALGALTIDLANCLHLGRGPLLRVAHYPGPDEPMRIAMSRLTLRDSDAVIAFSDGPVADRSGEISVEATACVFAPRRGAALLLFGTSGSPEPLLRGIRWTGQGSLVTPGIEIATWRSTTGIERILDDTSIAIAGMVRSSVQFAGDARQVPAGSKVLRWQAPLQSVESPGAAVERIPSPDPSLQSGHPDKR